MVCFFQAVFNFIIFRLFSKGLILRFYIYIWENHRIYPLRFDSLGTWLIAALLTDFCYYWLHRASHGKR